MDQDLKTTGQSAQPIQPADDKPARRVSRRGKARPINQANAPEHNKLRLVGNAAPDMKPPVANPTPISSATDPRWVLAVRTAQVLEGDVLPPTKRETLMTTGKAMGLTPFDCSLILAIVQDRARRGIAPDQCPAASEAQLALIPLPQIRPFKSILSEKPGQVILLTAGLIALQVLLIWIWLG